MMKIQHSVLGMCATNTYYVYDDETKRGLIVDPADSPDTIIAKADSLPMIPEAILITHGHFDHVLAMNKVREHYGIKVYAGLTEKQVLHDMAMNLTSSFGMGQIFDADIYLKDGEEFETAGYHIKAIEVPGHTIGGMCYYFDKQGVLFSGDTLFCESVGRSDFPGGSASALCRGIKDKLFILPEHTKVYPGHMDETTIGNEIKYNPFCR
ncbi:metallo-beta-lactamase family protein [Butyrivibrio sp. CAG:318]|jgi:metallo-beta-lactamase family protein|nr:metallo-beta-lactamase family protein [Butyrivibrio sp. CAG:318]